ncbi:MAG TPA: hypothetical protein VNV66_15760 [Pilimelia sp.]|nr:hypothetical protein [Pilimelia sp.]
MDQKKRRVIHFSFAAAAIFFVLFGTYGPRSTAAVGWLLCMAVTMGWFTYAVMEMRRHRKSVR